MNRELKYEDFELCRPWMVNLAIKCGIDPDTAHDVAQDALVKIYLKGTRDGFHTMQYNGKVNTSFVSTLVRNACYDILKSNKAKIAPLSNANALEDIPIPSDANSEPEEALCHLFAYLSRIDWFHFQIAVIHIIHRVPLTNLSKQTGINKRTLYKSLSYVKSQIAEFKVTEAKSAQAHRYIKVEGTKGCNIESLPKVGKATKG